MPARLEIQPLTPRLGAEISAIDITQIDASGFETLYRHWLERKVISTMHCAANDYDGYRRCLYRTTIEGATPLPA